MASYTPRAEWDIAPSSYAKNTVNPIRAIVDSLDIPKNPPKKLIPLSIGDPTVFGNLELPETAKHGVIKALESKKANGYGPSSGLMGAREAIAKKFSTPEAPLTPADVILASGCSGALALAIPALASPGDNILLPCPGFSLYATIMGHYSIESKNYNLDPEKQWQVDIEHMESLVDERTKAIVINNPANPTGSVYPKEHLQALLAFAEKHKLVVIADEIYGRLTFTGNTFHALATLTKTVPVIACGGLAKQYLCPGWRVGWLTIHDRNDLLTKSGVRQGLMSLSQLILGPSTLIQAAIGDIILETKPDFYSELNSTLEKQAIYVHERLEKIDGLKPIKPQGAMYVMIQVDAKKFGCATGTEWANKLLKEEYVFCLPGACFGAEDFVRIVFCAPMPLLEEACDRMEAFCKAHSA